MNRLFKILSDSWAMRRQDYDSFLSMLLPMVANNPAAAISFMEERKCESRVISPMCADANLCDEYDIDCVDLPDNSVAVLSLHGPLVEKESIWLAQDIAKAEANPHICGIVLEIDGPGGMSSHIEQAANAIKNCSKPIATVVTGMMMSAHFWLGTCAKRTFIETSLCEVGCVGVIIRWTSYEGLYKKLGITSGEVYATGSDLKNLDARKLDEGDDSLIRERADRINKVFCETVAENLGIEYDPELPIFRGATYYADEAVKLGYIDQVGSLDDAVRWVLGASAAKLAEGLY